MNQILSAALLTSHSTILAHRKNMKWNLIVKVVKRSSPHRCFSITLYCSEITSYWGSLNLAVAHHAMIFLFFYFLLALQVYLNRWFPTVLTRMSNRKNDFQVLKRKTSQHLISFQTNSCVILLFYCYLKSFQCFFLLCMKIGVGGRGGWLSFWGIFGI